MTAIATTARVEVDPFPTFILGPWAGAGLGVAFLSLPHPDCACPPVDPSEPAAAFDLGVEVRPVREFAIGIFVADLVLLHNPYPTNPIPFLDNARLFSLGLRAVGRY